MKITDHVCITWRPFWFWITLIILCAVLFLFASKMLAGSTIFLMANGVCGGGGEGQSASVCASCAIKCTCTWKSPTLIPAMSLV